MGTDRTNEDHVVRLQESAGQGSFERYSGPAVERIRKMAGYRGGNVELWGCKH